MNMIESNKILIRKLKHNDTKAFEQLFFLYAPKILNFSRKFLHEQEEAEEIVQVVFMAVWENRMQIDENKSFVSYIYTIARNWIFNTLKKKTYLKGFINYMLDNKYDYHFITDDTILFNELKEKFQQCIDELPPKRREVFLLSRNDGLSYQEIAQKLSITESTVNSQITKALEQIRISFNKIY